MVSQSDLLPMITATSGALKSDMAWRTNDAAGLEVSQGLSGIIAGHGRASPRDARRASRRARRRAPGRARSARARRARSPSHLRGPIAPRRAAPGARGRARERVLRRLRLRGALRGWPATRAAALAARAVPARGLVVRLEGRVLPAAARGARSRVHRGASRARPALAGHGVAASDRDTRTLAGHGLCRRVSRLRARELA